MKSSRNSVIISFGLGFLSCAIVVSIWHVAGIGGSTITLPRPGLGARAWHVAAIGGSPITDDILNGRLKIKLASKLKEDKKSSEELVELLEYGRELTSAVQYWEEDVRPSEIALMVWEEIYKNSYLEVLKRLAKFAIEHSDTTAGLTAKLLYTDLVPYLTGYGPMTEEAERRSVNCDLFLKEIIREHPKTWQASVAASWLVAYAPDDSEEDYFKEVQLLKERLEKENIDPEFDESEFEAIDAWFGFQNGPLKARILHTIAVTQYNLGTSGSEVDSYWLRRAQDTYRELIKNYPEYCKRCYISKKKIFKIDEMLENERRRKRIKER